MKIESIKTPGQYLNCSARHNTLKSAGFSTNPQLLADKLLHYSFTYDLVLS